MVHRANARGDARRRAGRAGSERGVLRACDDTGEAMDGGVRRRRVAGRRRRGGGADRGSGAVAFAAERGDDRVAVIDLETLEVVSEIPTGLDSGPGCMFWLAGD